MCNDLNLQLSNIIAMNARFKVYITNIKEQYSLLLKGYLNNYLTQVSDLDFKPFEHTL